MTGKRVLPAAILAVLFCILLVGLWPFNPYTGGAQHWMKGENGFHFHLFPPNEVRWLRGENGLYFGDYGTIFSSGPLRAPEEDRSSGASLELWIEPADTYDMNLIFAFYAPQNPVQFSVGQSGDSLVVSQSTPDGQGPRPSTSLRIEHVFEAHKKILITVSSGSLGTDVYLNGERVQTTPELKITAKDFTGKLVVGNSPIGNDTWGGKLQGMAFYSHPLQAQDARQDFEIWSQDQSQFPESKKAMALYRFREGEGNIVHNIAPAGPNLYIPEHFQILRQPLLVTPWNEFQNIPDYYEGLVINCLGFMPLGLLLCAYLSSVRHWKRPVLLAALAGGVISLTIEILQAYMPLRHSGMTDIITNTTGTALGAVLWHAKQVQSLSSRLGLGS
jgi:hypothetical protein